MLLVERNNLLPSDLQIKKLPVRDQSENKNKQKKVMMLQGVNLVSIKDLCVLENSLRVN